MLLASACAERSQAPLQAPPAPLPPVDGGETDATSDVALPQNLKCGDPSTAQLFRDGQWLDMPCRGPKGCWGAPASPHCDDDLAQAGEVCVVSASGDNLACAMDKLSELKCVTGVWKVTRTCKGPKTCSVAGNLLHCDDSMGDVNDPCVVESGLNNYGCSSDKTIEVVCDAATSKFLLSQACRGPNGCHIEGGSVYCDRTMARAGEKCRPVDNHSCSEDATQELKCSPQLTWIKQRDCKHSGCKIKSENVYCN